MLIPNASIYQLDSESLCRDYFDDDNYGSTPIYYYNLTLYDKCLQRLSVELKINESDKKLHYHLN